MLTLKQAIDKAKQIRPKIIIPIHDGMLKDEVAIKMKNAYLPILNASGIAVLGETNVA